MNSRLFLRVLALMLVSPPALCAAENSEAKDTEAVQEETESLSFLRIAEIGTEKVDVLFTGYFIQMEGDPEKPDPESWSLSINWETERMTKFVPYDSVVHGFRLSPLGKKVVRQWNPRLRKWVNFEEWTLTLSKDGKAVAQLRLGDQAQIDEPYVVLEIKTGENEWEKTGKLFVDSEFKARDHDLRLTGIGEDSVTIGQKDGTKSVIKKQ